MGNANENELVTQMDVTSSTETVVWTPNTLLEALDQKQRLGDNASYIAGGTLLQLQREQGTPLTSYLISLDRIRAMKDIQLVVTPGRKLRIGALTTLTDCLSNDEINKDWELLSTAAKEVASPAVRNRGTIGGNIGYRIGDTIPALLALNAEITLFDGVIETTNPLWDYLKSPPDSASIITSILLPEPPISTKEMKFYRKVGRREAFIPSLVTVAAYCLWNSENQIDYIRIGVAGGASSPQRLESCEEFLTGKVINPEVLEQVYQKITEEFTPKSDNFVSAHYRKTVVANLIVSELENNL